MLKTIIDVIYFPMVIITIIFYLSHYTDGKTKFHKLMSSIAAGWLWPVTLSMLIYIKYFQRKSTSKKPPKSS